MGRLWALNGDQARRHRKAAHPGERLAFGDQPLVDDGRDVRLTPTEWHLLEVLARHPGRLVGHRQLLLEVWGPGYEEQSQYLRVYVAALRRKLEPTPAVPAHLLTEPGMGYRLQP